MKIIKYLDNYKVKNDKVIMVLIRMLIIFGTFTLGIAIGASLAFEGIIEKPSYCYEEFENEKKSLTEKKIQIVETSKNTYVTRMLD